MKRSTLTVLVAGLMVASVLVGAVGSTTAAPQGFVNVPDSNITEDLPGYYEGNLTAADLRGSTLATENASTLEVTVTTAKKAKQTGLYRDSNFLKGEHTALIFRDDVNHAGREVALDAETIRSSFGHVPERVKGVHDETGEEWSRETRLEDGSLIFEIPKFSSNAITFSGTVELTGDRSTDGSTYEYDLEDLDAVSNFTIDLTGAIATETEVASGAALSNGDTFDLDVAGNLPATDATVTLTGNGFETTRSENGTTTPSTTVPVTVDGNLEPTGPDGSGAPEVTLTGSSKWSNISRGSTWYFDDPDWAVSADKLPDNIDTITVEYGDGHASGTDGDAELYIVQGNTDDGALDSDTSKSTVTHLGTVEASYGSTVVRTIDAEGFDTTGASTWTFEVQSADDNRFMGGDMDQKGLPPQNVELSDDAGTSKTVGTFNEGETKTTQFNLSSSATSVTIGGQSGSIDYSIDYTDNAASEDPSLDVDGDGTDDASYTGLLHDGDTHAVDVSDLEPGSGPAAASLTSGTVDASVEFTERTETENVDVEVNGNTTNHSGSLSDGSTTSLSTEESWLREGTNRVNLSVASSLSSDAPTGIVGLNYSHEATSTQSVTYEGTTWTERYNVSHTYASDRSDTGLTIPFDSQVFKVGYLEQRVNGGEWSDVASSDYQLDGTDLTVELGSVESGDEVEVRAEGRLVKVHNGTITVDDPTVRGDDLSTQFTVEEKGEGMYLDVSDTEPSNLHYLASKSWTGETNTEVRAGGQQYLHLKGANAGSTARAETLPLSVEPEAGALETIVVDDSDPPRFELRKGNTGGSDDVRITWYNALSGESYELYNHDRNEVEMTSTANSPVEFLTGNLAEYSIREAEPSSATVGVASGGGGGGGALPVLALFAGLGISMTGFVFVGRKLGASGGTENALLLVGGSVVGLVGVEAVTANSIVSSVVFALTDLTSSFGSGVASTGAGTIVLGAVMLIGIWLVDSRVWDLPRWLVLVLGGGVGVWVMEDVTGGALSSGLSEISALVWLILLGGGILIVYRALKPTSITIRGTKE